MKTVTSVDTNILLYSLNADAPENDKTRIFYSRLTPQPSELNRGTQAKVQQR